MRDDLSINPKALIVLGIQAGEGLDVIEAGIRRDLDEGMRLALRIAVRVAVAKRAHFGGEFGPWLEWIEQSFHVGKRSAITWCNAGECLIRNLVHHGALIRCDLQKLEIVAPLDRRQMEYLVSKYPEPGSLDRTELRRIVATIRGRSEDGHDAESGSSSEPVHHGAPKQLLLPGIEELLAAPVDDPQTEWRYAGAHLTRMARAYEAAPQKITTDELAAMQQHLAQTLSEITRELRSRMETDRDGEIPVVEGIALLPAPERDVDTVDVAALFDTAGSIGG